MVLFFRSPDRSIGSTGLGYVYLFIVILLGPSPFDFFQASPGLAFAFSFFSCFTCVFATFDVLTVFFHGFGTPVFLPHIFDVLEPVPPYFWSCFWPSFLSIFP